MKASACFSCVALGLSLAIVSCDAPHVGSLPVDFQRGVNHAHIHRSGHGYGSAVSAAELAELKKLGVDSIAITPFGYQPSANAVQITGFGTHEVSSKRDPTLTDQHLADEVRSAHQLGMRVVLKPHIWSHDFWDGREWQGTIRQSSPEAHAGWWTCYREFALHHAAVAERSGADMYCIGTELVHMTTAYPGEWRELIADIRKVYRGKLTYAAHSQDEFDEIIFWDALDFIGITAYFSLDAPEGATVKQLVAAWKPHRERIARLQGKFNRPVLFLEVGYRPVADTHQKPWTYDGGKPDSEAQARAYEALFEAFADAPWWNGAYIWKTFTDPTLADKRGDGVGFSFRGRPAEAVIDRWYGGSRQRD